MKKRSILFAFLVLALAAAATGYYFYNKGPLNVRTSRSISIQATALYNDYIIDSLSAHKKYDAKVLEVSGTIKEVRQNNQGQQVILLNTATDGGYINCTMENPAGNLKAAANVLIKGICSGIGQGDADLGIPGDVYLTRSMISK